MVNRAEEEGAGSCPPPSRSPDTVESGIESVGAFPRGRHVRRRPLRGPLAVHRQPEPRAVAADDELGQHAADPAEPGLVADVTAWAPRTRTSPGSSSSAPASRWWARSSGATASCPASIQGSHINNRTARPRADHPRHPQSAPVARPPSASNSTSCGRLNTRPPARARPRRASGSPDRLHGSRLPHAVRGPRGVRRRPASRRPPATCTVRVSSPTPV